MIRRCFDVLDTFVDLHDKLAILRHLCEMLVRHVQLMKLQTLTLA